MNDYRVEKIELPVTLFLADGVVHEGILFLSPFSPSHSGQQRLVEMFYEPDVFFPFRDKSGRFALVNKSAITHVRYPLQEEEREFGKWSRVRLTFYGGDLLEGDIVIAMPADKGRLQDYVNSTPGFFCLYSHDAHYIVNGDLIREIAPA